MNDTTTTTEVKQRRYTIHAREFGRRPASVSRFRSLDKAAQYIRDRWQGAEYIDGRDVFHTDFCQYRLIGFDLRDIGKLGWEEEGGHSWRTFAFNEPQAAPLAEDCAGAKGGAA